MFYVGTWTLISDILHYFRHLLTCTELKWMHRSSLFPKERHKNHHEWKPWWNLNNGTGRNLSRLIDKSYKTREVPANTWFINFIMTAYLTRGSHRHRSAWRTTADHGWMWLHVDPSWVCAMASACLRACTWRLLLSRHVTTLPAQSRHPSPVSFMQDRQN